MLRGVKGGKHIVVYVGTHKLFALQGVIAGESVKIAKYATDTNPDGFRGGVVSNLEQAAFSIQALVESLLPSESVAELACHVVLGNPKLRTYNFSSSQYYSSGQRTVTSQDIRSVVEQTRSVATLPLSEFVLQSLPESFIVNDMRGIRNPLGLEASRLGVDLNLFTMNFEDFKNINRAFEATEMEVLGYYPKTLMLSEAVLTPAEREEGVMTIDIADDATHLVLWKNGYLVGTSVLPLGGRTLTEKIAAEWEIEVRDAEKVKERYGSLDSSEGFTEELIPLVERNGKGNHQIRLQSFRESFISDCDGWLEKILQAADDFAQQKKVLYPHYVVTGGGTRLDGFIEFLHKRFSLDARIGLTRKVEAPHELLADPSAAAGLGMLRWLQLHQLEHDSLMAPRNIVEKTLGTAKRWFANYF